MLGKVNAARCAARFALASAAVVVAVGVVALPASADDGIPTECSGSIGADTLSAVEVPQGAACSLEGTTVTGDVVVGIDATLTTTDDTTIQGMVSRPVDCTGALGAVTVDNLVVPDGATCTLSGTTVTGNVKVGAGSSFITDLSTIEGNVQATDGPATVQLVDTNIGLVVHVQHATGPIVIGGAGCAVDPTVGHDVILQENLGTIALCYLSVGNNIILQDNAKSIGVFNNEIGNNLIVENNTGRWIRIRHNHIGFSGGGGIKLTDNAGQGVLRANNVGNAINCTGNTMTPYGGHNTAGSGLHDQCAALG